RTLDQSLKRGGRRAALEQWWTPQIPESLGHIDVGSFPLSVKSDGEFIWVANFSSNNVYCVRASDGKVIRAYTGVNKPRALLVARGKIYVAGNEPVGTLYAIDPTIDAPATVAADIGSNPVALAFDGKYLWCTNFAGN